MINEELSKDSINEEPVDDTPQESTESVGARKQLLIFWFRMFGWLATGVAAPITTFAIKFGLFQQYGYTITTDELGNVTGAYIALNGWGMISAFLIGAAIYSIINEIVDAYSKTYSFTKQCLVGLKNKIIPIAIAIAVCFWLKGNIEQMIFCLIVLGISQIAAVPLNPMPEWKSRKKGEEDYSDLVTGFGHFLKEYFKKRKGGK